MSNRYIDRLVEYMRFMTVTLPRMYEESLVKGLYPHHPLLEMKPKAGVE